MKHFVIAAAALVLISLVAPATASAKTNELGKMKFKDFVKFLSLDADQQEKVRTDFERIQQIQKEADKQKGAMGGWTGGGRRAPLGGGGPFGRPGDAGGGMTPNPQSSGKYEETRAQRQEWQKEITNRVEEMKSFLGPAQLEKFKSLKVPNLMELPSRPGWRD